MLTLYYCPLACSMASHVALAAFEAKKINIFKGEQHAPEYLAINPRAKVPTLRFEDGSTLTESTAILAWIGTNFPKASLLGPDRLYAARTIAFCAWLSSSVHPAFGQFVHPERLLADKGGHAAVKADAKETFWGYLQEIDATLSDHRWLMGDYFTVADPYALVFYPWGRELGLPVKELKNFTSLKDRIIARPGARRALEREKSIILSM